jgi:hypothetical protein
MHTRMPSNFAGCVRCACRADTHSSIPF